MATEELNNKRDFLNKNKGVLMDTALSGTALGSAFSGVRNIRNPTLSLPKGGKDLIDRGTRLTGKGKTEKISFLATALIVGLGLLADIIQAILLALAIGSVVNTIIAIVVNILFITMFVMYGIPVINPKKILRRAVFFLGEFIPILNSLPLYTIGTIVIIIGENIERKENKKAQEKAQAEQQQSQAEQLSQQRQEEEITEMIYLEDYRRQQEQQQQNAKAA